MTCTYTLVTSRHLSNTSSVVTDGTEHIDRETRSKCGEHTKTGKCDTKHSDFGEGNKHNECDHKSGNNGRLISKGKTHDDVRGSTCLGGLCDLTNGFVPVFEREARVKFYVTFECAFERCVFE